MLQGPEELGDVATAYLELTCGLVCHCSPQPLRSCDQAPHYGITLFTNTGTQALN